jgi:hypothetical protein
VHRVDTETEFPSSELPLSTELTLIITVGLAIVFLVICASQWFLGPVYVLEDGCACGLRRQWYGFDECRALRQKRFFLKVLSEGDPKQQHLYWDATWNEQFWLLPSR